MDEGSIGARIKRARKERGLSQADLASRIGVSQPAIATWESGAHDPRRLALARVSEALSTPLEWLAAGARSPVEGDKQAAAAYLRRLVQHVPVISFEAAANFVQNTELDLHKLAEDYIPISASTAQLFAFFSEDPAVESTFPKGTLVVIDYTDRTPQDGAFCLAILRGAPILRRWREGPDRLEPHSGNGAYKAELFDKSGVIVGCAVLSIRFH